jgi:hypothetical protein
MAEPYAEGLRRRTLTADALVAGTYLAGTNTRRIRRTLKALFWRRSVQGRGEPDLAQGKGRLGCLERPLESARYIATVVSRRYRFVASVTLSTPQPPIGPKAGAAHPLS